MSVIDRQRYYQKGHGPIYIRSPGSNLAFKGLIAMLVCGSAYGAYNLGKLIGGHKP